MIFTVFFDFFFVVKEREILVLKFELSSIRGLLKRRVKMYFFLSHKSMFFFKEIKVKLTLPLQVEGGEKN